MASNEPLRIESGELTAEEILDALESGRRVVVRTEVLGGHEVTLRHDGTTYYCDTPTTLHKHATADEMRTCIDRMGYGRVMADETGAGADAGDEETGSDAEDD